MFLIWKEHRHFGKQIMLLSKNELIKTYKGAFLGYAWAIIKPVFTLLALWFLFALGLRGNSTRHGMFDIFPFLLTGYVPWFFINDSMLFGTKSIRRNSQFVTKISYPVSTIMTFTNLSKIYINFLLTGIMYLILICFCGVSPSIYNLQYFIYMPLMFLFFLGLSWINAPLAVLSKDFENLINSILTMLFWVSGSLFDTYGLNNEFMRKVMYFNPITFFVNGFRKTFLYNEWFWQHSIEITDKSHVLYSSFWENIIFFIELIAVLIIGSIVYKKTRKTMADIL